MKLLWNVLRVLSALVIPTAATLLTLKKIDNEKFLIIIACFGAYLIVREIIELMPDREMATDANRKIPAGNTLLKSMLADCSSLLVGKEISMQSDIRANVMMIHHGLLGARMRIVFQSSMDRRTGYFEAERGQPWKKSQGAVGRVWSSGTEDVFCKSDVVSWNQVTSSLSTEQRKVVGKVGAIYSVPIHSDRKNCVIGLLNIDSKSEVKDSYLGDEDIKGIVRGYANVLRPLCAENGISKTGK
jgi:hypothetical protein